MFAGLLQNTLHHRKNKTPLAVWFSEITLSIEKNSVENREGTRFLFSIEYVQIVACLNYIYQIDTKPDPIGINRPRLELSSE